MPGFNPDDTINDNATEADGPSLATVKVDYVVDSTWLHAQALQPKVLVLEPPAETGQNGTSSVVRRLVMPRKLEDLFFLRMVAEEHLRVEVWPHGTPHPHMHVRIYTDVISFPPAVESQSRWSKVTRFLRSHRHWMLLLQVTVNVPKGVSLMGCSPIWRWVDVNNTNAFRSQVISPPFRVLEIACPLRPRGFLGLPLTPGETGTGDPSTKQFVINALRMVFVTLLVVVCGAQVILLLLCITVLIAQMGAARRGGGVR